MATRLKTLIADDTRIVLERLAEIVSEVDGVDVVGLARNTSEAISHFDELNPDLVIVDVQMPGGSGLDVLHHIKSNRPDVTVVMMTSSLDPQYREVSIKGGADFFMVKAHDLAHLITVIKNLTKTAAITEAAFLEPVTHYGGA